MSEIDLGATEDVWVESPRGKTTRMRHRLDTSDLSTIGATFALWGVLHDEYQLRNEHLTGLFVDIGAHIGTVAIAALQDNPEARAILVEPLPENAEMCRVNLQLNGLQDRALVIEAAIGNGEPTLIRYGDWPGHKYIGDSRNNEAHAESFPVPSVTLEDIFEAAEQWEYDGSVIVKTDCEGGEWALFADPDVHAIDKIMGEYHTLGSQAVIDALPGWSITFDDAKDDSGLFWATR